MSAAALRSLGKVIPGCGTLLRVAPGVCPPDPLVHDATYTVADMKNDRVVLYGIPNVWWPRSYFEYA